MNSLATFHPASRVRNIEVSEIVTISETAARLRQAGRDVIALSTGEPDLPTPDHVVAAAHAAALSGKTRYTPTPGTTELRQAVAAASGRSVQEVIVSAGAKQVIFNALLASLEPGDGVIIAAPYWTSYVDMIAVAGGSPVIVPSGRDQGFKLSAVDLEGAITQRTRWVLFNSPSNPAGAVYSEAEIKTLGDVLARHPHVWVMADEIYEHLSFVPFVSFAQAAPHLQDRLLIVNGASKAWAMTGWRIGWGIAPAALVRAMTVIQGQSTSGACSISQAATLSALTGDQSLLKTRCDIYRARRDSVVAGLNAVPGIECPSPDGSFYAFASCEGVLKAGAAKARTDSELCNYLLEDAGVAVVPGRAFGMPDHFRLSFAYSDASLSEGVSRIFHSISKLLQ